jgi:hypothetical protein
VWCVDTAVYCPSTATNCSGSPSGVNPAC